MAAIIHIIKFDQTLREGLEHLCVEQDIGVRVEAHMVCSKTNKNKNIIPCLATSKAGNNIFVLPKISLWTAAIFQCNFLITCEASPMPNWKKHDGKFINISGCFIQVLIVCQMENLLHLLLKTSSG